MISLKVSDLSKVYRIPKPQPPATSAGEPGRLRSALTLAPIRRYAREALTSDNIQDLWALRDVSFEVEPGSVLGLIGPNGAGKSTLLKVISRIVEPTTGMVSGRGRVVSLLELGAGFDEDASARENIYLNAAMYGIPRSVVDRRFDEIIAFAGIEKFVDTNLQYFSSGMYLRLAFSVAINMEPNILLADEILAVGDATFQEQCLQKVAEAGKQGLTVVFVSHDMDAVARICSRVIWLKNGSVHRDGDGEEVVSEYQQTSWEVARQTNKFGFKGSHVNRYGEIVEVRLVTSDGREIGAAPTYEDVSIRIRFKTHNAKVRARCAIDLFTKGVHVLRSTQAVLWPVTSEAVYEAFVRIPKHLLSETKYTVDVTVLLIRGEGEEHALVMNKALAFMTYGAADERGKLRKTGVIAPTFEWTIDKQADVVRA